MSRADPLDPELLLRAYTMGVLPMADDRDATSVYWVEPQMATNTMNKGRRTQ